MRLRYYLGLYGAYFRLGLKTMAQYRADVWIMAVSTAIRDGATLLFLSVIFGKITQLQGWSFYGIVLIYGLGTVSGTLLTLFLNMPHSMGWYVLGGQLDVLLVRPARPLFQMLGERCLNPVGASSLVRRRSSHSRALPACTDNASPPHAVARSSGSIAQWSGAGAAG